MTADEFNAKYAVGTPVVAYPGARPEDDADCVRIETVTIAAAADVAGGPAVMVDGYDRIQLSHIDIRTAEEA